MYSINQNCYTKLNFKILIFKSMYLCGEIFKFYFLLSKSCLFKYCILIQIKITKKLTFVNRFYFQHKTNTYLI